MSKTAINLDLIGGLDGLRMIITDFYQRIFNDAMIAYLFTGQSQQRLIEREVEWTARLLGAHQIEYKGQSLKQAHSKHPIRKGHFFRRHQLLAETLKTHQVPQEVQDMWLTHSLSLIHVILGAAHTDQACEMTSQTSGQASTSTPGLWISTREE